MIIPGTNISSNRAMASGKLYYQVILSSLMFFASKTLVIAQEFGLPVVGSSEQPGQVISDLTSPALHAPGVNLGLVSGVYSANGHELTIKQTSNTAIIDWNQFNIAEGNSVNFQQPNADAIALNNIHQLNASQILGDLSANGQLYLINSDGFVFGAHSQVNVNTLLASSLSISDNVFQQGIVNVVSSGASSSNANGSANNKPVAALSADGTIYRNTGGGLEKIRVWVEKGAQINAADSGRVILAAPEVENDGHITAPDGQVILVAATDKVYLQESSSQNLRGLLVEVNTGGDVKNLGSILTERGNTTLMGFAVSQQGIVSASTSVALNGSVRLLAREGAQLVNISNNTTANYLLEPAEDATIRTRNLGDGLSEQASVTLANASKTQVTLDNSSAAAAQTQPQSVVDIEAGFIDLQPGANITAHAGQVNLVASASPVNSNQDYPAAPPQLPVSSDNPSRILMENGSKIDVSGVKNVQMSMDSNQLSLKLYSYELRNDPWQKNGVLYGQTVNLDNRYGTHLADISGAQAKLQFSNAYRHSNAGTVNFNSDGDTQIEKGAMVDISGGWLNYQAGYLQNTELVSANGSVFSLADASPLRLYQQIFNLSSYQPGYQQGMNAGQLNINSRDTMLDGAIMAQTLNGQYQRSAGDQARGGQLNIDSTWSGDSQLEVIFQNQISGNPIPVQYNQQAENFQNLTPTTPYQPLPIQNNQQAQIFQDQTYSTPLTTSAITTPLNLTNSLFANGLQDVSIKTGGYLYIAANTQIQLPAFGKLSLQAGMINDNGHIQAPSGSVSLLTQVGLDSTFSQSGEIVLNGNAVIDTSGVWVNDWQALQQQQNFPAIDSTGGAIDLTAQGDLIIQTGAQIHADGGAWLQSNGQIQAGKGGNITLVSAGNDSKTSMQLNGDMTALGLTEDGSLSIAANSLQLAQQFSQPAALGQLQIPASLLNAANFANFNLTANNGDLQVASATKINLQQANWQLQGLVNRVASGTALRQMAESALLPQYQRQPVNLNLQMLQTVQGVNEALALSIADGASIQADPQAKISLLSDANINVEGIINAPAGSINLSIQPPPNASSDPGYNPNQAITLGARSQLSATGAEVLTPNSANLSTGELLDAGTVSLNAERGYVLMANGANIDVSGISAWMNVINTQGISLQQIATNAGVVNLTAAEGMLLNGSFSGKAGAGAAAAGGGSSVSGGRLNLSLNAQNRAEPFDVLFPTADRVIHVTQQPSSRYNADVQNGSIAADLNGQASISAQQIQQGGFDSVKLQTFINTNTQSAAEPQNGAIEFDGALNLAVKLGLELDAPQISQQGVNGVVSLHTDVFTLGSSQNQTPLTQAVADVSTQAILQVQAQHIDLRGATSINDFSATKLYSNSGVQLIGVNPNEQSHLIGALNVNGELDISAQAIYPASMTQFSFNDNASNGVVNISAVGNAPSTPLSAAGAVSITAPVITDSGRILAPFGAIKLTASDKLTLAAGSLTAVADTSNSMIPFGYTQGNGQYWIYPLGTAVNIQSGTPQKTIDLSSPDLNLQAGSQINLNGGGNLMAYELTPAPGGNLDYLSAAYQQSFAILPQVHGGFASYDPLQSTNSGLTAGADIYLSAVAGLAAGDYQLLPAYDALLPGAFLVTPVANTAGMAANTTQVAADGGSVAAGYRYQAGSQVSDSQWSGFEVQSGQSIVGYSPYLLSSASQFFATHSNGQPSLPQDAGSLSLTAEQNLAIDGQISAKALSGGLGGMLDISAANLVLANQAAPALNGVITLSADNLNKLGVDSILIGGRRSRNSDGVQIAVTTDNLTVAANTSLHAPEIILAANNDLAVQTGAHIAAQGILSHSDLNLQINGSGALLRVSDAGQASLQRQHDLQQQGDLNIATGANLSSSGSILLDASHSGNLQGNIIMPQGQLSINSGLITLGGVAGSDSGMQLSNSLLQGLHVGSLQLNSAAINIADGLNIQLNSLILDSAVLNSDLSAGQTAQINAANLQLQNTTNASNPLITSQSQGILQLQANQITLGAGNYALSGFNQVNLSAKQAVLDSGASHIKINSDVNINTQVWTTLAGANTTLDAGGQQLSITGGGGNIGANLGGQLSVNAGVMDVQGLIAMPSGSVTLTAQQDLSLAASADINVGGQKTSLPHSTGYSSGGSINLRSLGGNVNDNAQLNVAAASGGGNAGSINISAATGAVNLAGAIAGAAGTGGKGGNINVFAQQNPDSALNNLLNQIQQGGFTNSVQLRYSQGDINLLTAESINAAAINLTADNGVITIAGALNASGAQAGNITISANNGINIDSTANINASASGTQAAGGKIILSSTPINGGGSVNIANGAAINVAAGAGGAGGKVLLNVNRVGNADAAVNIAAAVQGASELNVYAFSHDLNPNLSNTEFTNLLADSQNYMLAASAQTNLQQRLDGFSLLPGIDIVSNNSLNWNITAALTGQVDTPGMLSIRSAGDVNINQTLSDGFIATQNQLHLSTGASWAYQIIAGADLNSANQADTVSGVGNITIAPNTSVRTGTGDIDLAAGGNIRLSDWTSTIYTAGHQSTLLDPYAKYRPGSFAVQYPDQGGDLSLQAGENIIGASTPQIVSDWLQRSGNWNPNGSIGKNNLPTAWGIDFGELQPKSLGTGTSFVNAGLGFMENIGALGGGNVRINAGNNINDLSVVLPTNAVTHMVNGVAQLTEQAGGNLSITAGGNIAGGLFYVEKGQAQIQAAGAITGGSEFSNGPVLAIGNAQFNVTADSGIDLSTVLNPFVIAQAGVQSSKMDYFSTYTAKSALNLQSYAGNIVLANNQAAITQQIQQCVNAACNSADQQNGVFYNGLSNQTDISPLLAMYPGALQTVAWQGSIEIGGSMSLYAAANTSFNLIAAQNITLDNNVVLSQLDVDPSQLLPLSQPLTSFSLSTDYWLPNTYDNPLGHAAQPVHAADTTLNYLLAGGNIIGLQDGGIVAAAKATQVAAADNINNLSLYLQNLPTVYQDVSSVSAGGDIVFPSVRNPVTGAFQGAGFIKIAGPGRLDISAGGKVDLGVSDGITSSGGLYNSALLAYPGADISVLAGVNSSIVSAGLQKYLQNYVYNPSYQQQLQTQLAALSLQNTSSQALAADYHNLLSAVQAAANHTNKQSSQSNQLHWALPILFSQFRLAVDAANINHSTAPYQAGYDAIKLMFPKPAAGDIVLDFSRIQTLAGGNINLLAPGGSLNVGLAASDIAVNKTAAELGVVTQATGNVNILTNGNVLVNESRLFTLEGGNITVWSSWGDIDAGRGANSAFATPLPVGNFDAYGNMTLAYPAQVSGSGIHAQSGYKSNIIGNLSLAAPHGVINAGEAGIAGNNVSLGAEALVNAGNIQVQGLSLGLPPAQNIGAVSDVASAVAAAATRLSSMNFDQNEDAFSRASKTSTAKIAILDVQIIGFGECSVLEVKAGKLGCGD